jgi:hypothetical protein
MLLIVTNYSATTTDKTPDEDNNTANLLVALHLGSFKKRCCKVLMVSKLV